MIYNLTAKEQGYLIDQPETGMGYQIVEAQEFGNYAIKRFIILNSTLAIESDNAQTFLKQIFKEGFEKIRAKAQIMSFKNIKVLNKIEAFGLVNDGPANASKGAKDSIEERANGSEIFIRLSAYLNDRRIDRINKCLRPGSFTTTFIDYELCKNNKLDPIARYALPNEENIKWVFYIKPKILNILQRGVVQPANNQLGGGKEIYFKNGTSPSSFIAETKY